MDRTHVSFYRQAITGDCDLYRGVAFLDRFSTHVSFQREAVWVTTIDRWSLCRGGPKRGLTIYFVNDLCMFKIYLHCIVKLLSSYNEDIWFMTIAL